ncbi:hypothetical protein ACO2KH_17770 [Leptospira terpstrae]|uniref:hypothetical protein n=1 Tax=Leptospira terpstrae TaxID=293075 RepID=UPI003D082813
MNQGHCHPKIVDVFQKLSAISSSTDLKSKNDFGPFLSGYEIKPDLLFLGKAWGMMPISCVLRFEGKVS